MDRKQRSQLEVIVETEDGKNSLLFLDSIRELGSGGGAVVDLYSTLLRRNGVVEETLVAEKAFKSSGTAAWLARAFNFFALQTVVNPYAHNYHAIRAAYYRRKVLGILTEHWFGESRVADALYTRFDAETGCFALGTEFVDGRGYTYQDKETVLPFLEKLAGHMKEAGLYGPMWSVDPDLVVSTCNVVINRQGKPAVTDLESSVAAAIPVPLPRFLKYWAYGLRNGTFPLHDDIDYRRFRSYTAGLEAHLPDDKLSELMQNAELLENHERLWKLGEVALLRNGVRSFSKAHRRAWAGHLNARHADYWLRTGTIDAAEAANIRAGRVERHDLSRRKQRISVLEREGVVLKYEFTLEQEFTTQDVRHDFLREKARNILFLDAIRRHRELGFITEVEAERLKEVAYNARLQLKDALGILVQAAISLPPGTTIGPISAFLLTGEPAALAPFFAFYAAKNAYNLAALALVELFHRDGRSRNWPLIIGSGLVPLPIVSTLGYPLSVYMDNRSTGIGDLFRLGTRHRIVQLLDKLPYFGDYNSRFAQGVLGIYDSVFYRSAMQRRNQ